MRMRKARERREDSGERCMRAEQSSPPSETRMLWVRLPPVVASDGEPQMSDLVPRSENDIGEYYKRFSYDVGLRDWRRQPARPVNAPGLPSEF